MSKETKAEADAKQMGVLMTKITQIEKTLEKIEKYMEKADDRYATKEDLHELRTHVTLLDKTKADVVNVDRVDKNVKSLRSIGISAAGVIIMFLLSLILKVIGII